MDLLVNHTVVLSVYHQLLLLRNIDLLYTDHVKLLKKRFCDVEFQMLCFTIFTGFSSLLKVLSLHYQKHYICYIT